MVRKILSKASEKTLLFGLRFREQTAAAIIAAFGFVIALAWKDVITSFISYFTPVQNLFISAVLITALSVIGIAFVSRWAKQPITAVQE